MKVWEYGEIRNGHKVLPKNERKKILLISDGINFNSGIATMSREFVLGTVHHFNWVQIASAIDHPDKGKIINVDQSVQKETGVPDPAVTLYPTNGYGDVNVIRVIIEKEKPDALMIYTDPRFFIHIFDMAHEIRQNMPIFYYNIWDDLPYPKWNKAFYESCDLLMNISKQTVNIVKHVVGENDVTEIDLHRRSNKNNDTDDIRKTMISYIPHGINHEIFCPVDENNDKEYLDFKKQLLGENEYDFILLFNNRNIRRKAANDVILAFKYFNETLTEEQRKKTLLLFKTAPMDPNGTDLNATHRSLCPELNIRFVNGRLSPKQMSYLYNISDVGMNISSAEGFGLSCAESIMCGTPVIATVIGGLQDQMRFEDEEGKWINFDVKHPTNSDGKYTKHAEWAFPVFPESSLQGSPPTPYIYDSRMKILDVVNQLINLYEIDRFERKSRGLKGREWLMSEESMMSATKMCQNFIDDMNFCFEHWKPINRYEFINVENKKDNRYNGTYNPILKKWD